MDTSNTPPKNLPWRLELLGKNWMPQQNSTLWFGWNLSCRQYGQGADTKIPKIITDDCSGHRSRSLPSPFPLPPSGATPLWIVILNIGSETLGNGGACHRRPDGKWILDQYAETKKPYWSKPLISIVFGRAPNFDPLGHYSRPECFQLKVNRSGRICESMMVEVWNKKWEVLKVEIREKGKYTGQIEKLGSRKSIY